MKNDHDKLWKDALDESAHFAETALEKTLFEARRVRRRRKAFRSIGAATVIALLLTMGWNLLDSPAHKAPLQTAEMNPGNSAFPQPALETRANTRKARIKVQKLTDEQLLASFPTYSTGIIGSGNQKRFIIMEQYSR